MPSNIKPFARKVLLNEDCIWDGSHFTSTFEYGSNDYDKVLPQLEDSLKKYVKEQAGVYPTAVKAELAYPNQINKTYQTITVDVHVKEQDVDSFKGLIRQEGQAVADEQKARYEAAHDPVIDAERVAISQVHARNAETIGQPSEWLEINK